MSHFIAFDYGSDIRNIWRLVAKNQKFTWAQTVRDIAVEAIRKGQVLGVAVAAVLVVFVWRMPEQNLIQIWQDLKDTANRNWLASLILNVALAVLWFVHARRMRRRFEGEFERVCEQRNQLQEKLGVKVKSSNH